MNKKPLILIVDDEDAILQTLKASLEDEQFYVQTISDGSKVLQTIGSLVPDLVLLDIFLPKYNGIDLLEQIRHEYPSQDVIMISGFGTISIAIDAIKKGAINFIEKPLNLDEILAKISYLKQASAEAKTIADRHDDKIYNPESLGIIGTSTLFNELVHYTSIVAPLNLPVIIYGPSGCGKTLFARYIHTKSTHDQQEFVALNAAGITHFSQEILQKKATLFVKNIHNLDLLAQKQLLHYLEQDNPCLRVIASSIPNLFKLVQDGMFNKSLFCKLNQTPLEIPSINKRRYDIPLLVNHFLHEANIKNGTDITISPLAMRLIRNHVWVGDVAQLKTFINILQATKKFDTQIIDEADIQKILPENSQDFIEEQLYSRFNSIQQATDAFQQRYLSHLLKMYRYDIAQLAEFLQIPIAQLHDKIVKLDINVR